MTCVPNNATICGGPGKHRGLGGSVSYEEACPKCGGAGWYVIVKPRDQVFRPRRKPMAPMTRAEWDASYAKGIVYPREIIR